MTRIVLLNGPPNSGKDVIASHIVETMDGKHVEFKESLFKLVKMLYGISDERFEELYSRELKEVPMAELGGISIRDAMIHVSEDVVKPNFGNDYFGRALSSSIRQGAVNVISDGGFEEEVVPLTMKYGKDNILVIKLYRDGCTFDGDSRDYLPWNFGLNYHLTQLHNNGTLEDAFEGASEIVRRFCHV